MKCVDLFSGTRSIAKAFEQCGFETFTIELDRQHKNINWYADIMEVTAKDIIERFGHPDVIWASPPCTTYSIAAISHHRKKEASGNLAPVSDFAKQSDELIKHTLDLIRELKPKYFFIENPRGGLRKMDFMQGIPRYTVTYCQYGDPYTQELIFNMQEKKCPKCGQIKDIGDFYSNKSRRDGFSVYCKDCIKNDSREYNERNKKQCKERLQKWREENPEKVKEQNRRWREENPDKEFEKQKRYRETHEEQLYLKGKKYREEHRDYFYNKARERKLSQKALSDGTVTLEAEQFIYDEQNGKCAYCGCDLNESGKHLDHIIPLSKGGLHTINNVHWTCPTCNLSKGDKLESEWLKKERMKPTDLFTNHPNPQFKPMCHNGDPCHEKAPRGSKTGTQGLKGAVERSVIPEELCLHIANICKE